jgi:hypothetical protein
MKKSLEELLKEKETELQQFIAQANVGIGRIQGQIELLKELIKKNENGKDTTKNES